MRLRLIAVLLLLKFDVATAATWGTWNGKTVGTSSGNISSLNSKTIGTASGNLGSFNGLVSPGGGGGGISPVQSTSGTAVTGVITLTLPGAYTAGNAIFVVAQTDNGDTLTIAQTGNSYTTVVSRDDANFANAYLWRACNIAGGSNNITVTSAGAVVAHAAAIEVSGLSASCDDQNTSSTYSFAVPTTGTTAATTTANEIVIAGFGYATGDASGLCTGYTQVAQINDTSQSRSMAMNYKIISSTGTQSCTQADLGGTHAGSGVIGTFK